MAPRKPAKAADAKPAVVDEDDGPAPHRSIPTPQTIDPAVVNSVMAQLISTEPWRARADAYDSSYAGPPHWVRAINVIAATGSLPLALREANVSRLSFNKRRERYPEFALAIDEANQYFRETSLEQTAAIRAIDGVLEPVYHKGAVVGYIRKPSDTLMVKLLEANNPEKFKPKLDVANTVNFNVKGGLDVDGMNEQERAVAEATAASGVPAPTSKDATLGGTSDKPEDDDLA